MVNDLLPAANAVSDIRIASIEHFDGDMHRHLGVDPMLDVSPHGVALQDIVNDVELTNHVSS